MKNRYAVKKCNARKRKSKIVNGVERRNVHTYVCMYVCMYVCTRKSSIFVLPLKDFFKRKNEDMLETHFWNLYREAISSLTMCCYILSKLLPSFLSYSFHTLLIDLCRTIRIE